MWKIKKEVDLYDIEKEIVEKERIYPAAWCEKGN
jgi:hypothetical protein